MLVVLKNISPHTLAVSVVSNPVNVWSHRHSVPHTASELLLIVPAQILFKITVSYRGVKGWLWGEGCRRKKNTHISHQTKRTCFGFKIHQKCWLQGYFPGCLMCGNFSYILHVWEKKNNSWHMYKLNKHVSNIHKDQVWLEKQQLLMFINSLSTSLWISVFFVNQYII